VQNQGPIPSEGLDLSLQAENFLHAKRSEGVTKGTLGFYRKKLKLFLDFCQSRALTRVDQVSPDEIRSFMNWLEDRGNNPGGRHTCYRALKTFLYWWYIEMDEPEWWRNPFKKAQAPKLPDQALDPVSMDDFERLLLACKGRSKTDVRDRAILHTLLASGLRASELCHLIFDHVDLLSGLVHVKRGKGGKDRITVINSAAKKAFRAWLKRRGSAPGPLFTTDEGDELSYWALREIVRRRAAKAGIKPPSLHGFRRAFTLSQLTAGVPETTVKRLLGHSDNSNLIHRYAKQVTRHLLDGYSDPLDMGW